MCYEGRSQLLSSQQTSPISGNCYCFIIVGNWFSQFSEIGVNKSTDRNGNMQRNSTTQLNTEMNGKCLIRMRSNLCYDNTDSSLDPSWLHRIVSSESESRMQPLELCNLFLRTVKIWIKGYFNRFILKSFRIFYLLSVSICPVIERLHHLYQFFLDHLGLGCQQTVIGSGIGCCIIPIICFGFDGPIPCRLITGELAAKRFVCEKNIFKFTLDWSKT